MDRILGAVLNDRDLGESFTVRHVVPARAACLEPWPGDLPAPLIATLRGLGLHGLYSHQRRALDLARAGQSFVVATPTASGKSLCFHLPVLETLLTEAGSRALYLFPTKALSRDQLVALRRLLDGVQDHDPSARLAAHVYDGDTPPHVRRALREEGDLILTNPYMLHAGILPHHAKWTHLFQGLRYVVIDEMHTLRGVFGSHVANVLRRLRRIAAHYGSRPRFLFASATLGNPEWLAEQLAGEPVQLVDEDGSPRGERRFAFVQPPVVHRQLGLRRSAMDQTVRLARPLLRAGLNTIFFERRRNGVEILLRYLRDLAPRVGMQPDQVRGYRGGYLPDVRREIEAGLRDGSIRCVVATNALELGIDIGGLDVAVLVGYPGSVAATFQRAGRAGRRDRPSLCALVGRSVATDQYLMHHPEFLFAGRPETAVIDPDNLVVRANQLKCAAFELPFRCGEEFGGEGDTGDLLDYLTREARLLAKVEDRYLYASAAFPAENVSLDTGDIDNFVILDAEHKTPIAEIDRPSAITMVHPEAIYNLQGEQYYVESMDYDGRRVYARRVDVDYYTEAEVQAEVRVLHRDREKRQGGAQVVLGDVEVKKVTTMYKKIRFYTRENIGAGDINLPPEELDTEGLALVIPDALLDRCGLYAESRGNAMQALADLARKVVPLWVRCDPSDVGATSEMRAPHFQAPTVFLWDEVPGGVGLCEAAYERLADILDAMAAVVAECPCVEGCPACVGASLAEGMREKAAVGKLLEAMLGRAVAVTAATGRNGTSS